MTITMSAVSCSQYMLSIKSVSLSKKGDRQKNIIDTGNSIYSVTDLHCTPAELLQKTTTECARLEAYFAVVFGTSFILFRETSPIINMHRQTGR